MEQESVCCRNQQPWWWFCACMLTWENQLKQLLHAGSPATARTGQNRTCGSAVSVEGVAYLCPGGKSASQAQAKTDMILHICWLHHIVEYCVVFYWFHDDFCVFVKSRFSRVDVGLDISVACSMSFARHAAQIIVACDAGLQMRKCHVCLCFVSEDCYPAIVLNLSAK